MKPEAQGIIRSREFPCSRKIQKEEKGPFHGKPNGTSWQFYNIEGERTEGTLSLVIFPSLYQGPT